MSAEVLGYVTVALRQSGHSLPRSPHESPDNSRPQFLQFANGRALTISIRELQKGDDGRSVRLVFLTTNTTQRHYLRQIIHSSKDRLSVIRLDDCYQTYRLLAAYVAFLDEVAGTTVAADPR
jgi:hypothetical protein